MANSTWDRTIVSSLTPDLRAWADHSRIAGALAAHGAKGEEWGDPSKVWVETGDAKAVIEFCKAFFTYVYVLPEQNRLMRVNTQTASQSKKDSNES